MPSGIWLYACLGQWLLLAIETILIVGLIRQVADVQGYWASSNPEHGIPVGSPAPTISGTDLFGRRVSVPSDSGRRLMLLFVSKGCGACHELMKVVPDLVHREEFDIVLIVGNNDLQTRLYLAEHRRETSFPEALVLADGDGRLFTEYHINATPYATLIEADGRVVAKGIASNLDRIDWVVRHADSQWKNADHELSETEGTESRSTGPANTESGGEPASRPLYVNEGAG